MDISKPKSDATSEEHVRIKVRLIRDEDGYPPVDWEGLWAEPVGDDLFVLDNSPFYARLLSWRDIVRAEPEGEMIVVREPVKRGGHTTVRLLFSDKSLTQSILQELVSLGCSYEGDREILYAIDVPPEVEYQTIQARLLELQENDVLDFEESCIQHECTELE